MCAWVWVCVLSLPFQFVQSLQAVGQKPHNRHTLTLQCGHQEVTMVTSHPGTTPALLYTQTVVLRGCDRTHEEIMKTGRSRGTEGGEIGREYQVLPAICAS